MSPVPLGRLRRRIALVGGGVHVATLVDELSARWPTATPVDLRLVARDASRLAVIAEHVRARLAGPRPDWTVSATTHLDVGAAGVDAVVLMVRVGGLAARAGDEAFPAGFGLVGDEGLGPGGMANALRTVPVVADLGRTIARVAPDAVVLNLTAPLPTTTRALLDAGTDAVGLCELPLVVRDRLRDAPGGGPGGPLALAGLNHLSWWWCRDPADGPALRGAALAARLVDRPTWDRYGAVPMPYYYRVLDPAAGARLGLVQPEGRAVQLAGLTERALDAMRAHPGSHVDPLSERATPWFDRAVVPVLVAWCGGPDAAVTLDVRNGALLSMVPADVVVEVPATVSAGRVDPEPPGTVPSAAADFIGHVARAEDLVHRAATGADADPADPLSEAVAVLRPDLGAVDRGRLVGAIVRHGTVAA